ncbi:MAG TPA: FAD-dependent monooxygenase [Burkholderiales bacterium]|jgi:ubiquinone biosynthesis UbiH/UbiF/VisC/COQ6 family hydroxylase
MDEGVVIIGAGPVGAALARALRGRSVALLARARHAPRPPASGSFDSRVYALTPGNVAFLESIGAWRAIPESRRTPVRAMQVAGDDGASRIEFDAYRAGVPALAWIVEDAVLQDALWQGLEATVAEPEEIRFSEKSVTVRSRDGGSLEARLVVGADGADSLVRRAAGIATKESDYGQAAVVANFRAEKTHRGTAFQWFRGGAVLALLPLPEDQVSMVWSLPAAEAKRVLQLAPDALCREVELASRGAVGRLELPAAPRSYPLRRLSARQLVAPRAALVGDAAHVIHPLAGQGLNLGLQDVRELAAILAGCDERGDPGDLRLLRRYERARAEPILAMNIAVDGLFTLFKGESRTLARLRNAGLNLVDRVPVLKNMLIRQAMN